MKQNHYLTREAMLHAAVHDPSSLQARLRDPEDAACLTDLCDKIQKGSLCEDDVPVYNGVYACYEEELEQYGSAEALCNGLCLNYEDLYDNKEVPYCDEYRKGFLEEDEAEEEARTDASLQGEQDANLLRDLIVLTPM